MGTRTPFYSTVLCLSGGCFCCLRRWRRHGGRLFGRFGLLRRGEDGVQRSAFHARHEFDLASVADIDDEPVDDLISKVTVSHLAPLEAQRGLHLVAFIEEADGLVLLGLIVV